MFEQEMLKILACPETKSPLQIADKSVIDRINAGIEKGTVVNRGGQKVSEKIDGGLIPTKNSKILYPIRKDIPVMLIDEGIPID